MNDCVMYLCQKLVFVAKENIKQNDQAFEYNK